MPFVICDEWQATALSEKKKTRDFATNFDFRQECALCVGPDTHENFVLCGFQSSFAIRTNSTRKHTSKLLFEKLVQFVHYFVALKVCPECLCGTVLNFNLPLLYEFPVFSIYKNFACIG